MLFKMLGVEHTWKQHQDMGPKPRQVFVTQSRVLATKVEEYFAKLMGSLEAATYSRGRLRTMEKDANRRVRLVDQDDNDHWRSDLPDKFSELSEEHFPLFITYDRVRIPTFWKTSVLPWPHSFARCFRTMSGGEMTTMVSLFQRPLPSRTLQFLQEAQRRL